MDDVNDNPMPVDDPQLNDRSQPVSIPEALEGQRVGLESESDNIPPSTETPAEPVLEPTEAKKEDIPATTPETGEVTPSEPVASEAVQKPANPLSAILEKCKAVIAGHKQKKLEKILQLAAQNGKIENGDVQKLLRVSPATANRYLDDLVRNGKLKRTGEVGHAVFYEVI